MSLKPWLKTWLTHESHWQSPRLLCWAALQMNTVVTQLFYSTSKVRSHSWPSTSPMHLFPFQLTQKGACGPSFPHRRGKRTSPALVEIAVGEDRKAHVSLTADSPRDAVWLTVHWSLITRLLRPVQMFVLVIAATMAVYFNKKLLNNV